MEGGGRIRDLKRPETQVSASTSLPNTTQTSLYSEFLNKHKAEAASSSGSSESSSRKRKNREKPIKKRAGSLAKFMRTKRKKNMCKKKQMDILKAPPIKHSIMQFILPGRFLIAHRPKKNAKDNEVYTFDDLLKFYPKVKGVLDLQRAPRRWYKKEIVYKRVVLPGGPEAVPSRKKKFWNVSISLILFVKNIRENYYIFIAGMELIAQASFVPCT